MLNLKLLQLESSFLQWKRYENLTYNGEMGISVALVDIVKSICKLYIKYPSLSVNFQSRLDLIACKRGGHAR